MDKKEAPGPKPGTQAEHNPISPSIAQLENFERAYIERFGLSLFPIKERDKVPMTPNGFKDATTSLDTYKTLHGGKPHNIGMPTGPINGVFVLDIDPRHGGFETFKHLMTQYGSMPPTWQATTQSGGTHYFFKWDENRPVGNRANILPGLDIRGDGGYVLIAPSMVEGSYSWVRSPSKFELQPAPDWLWILLEETSKPAARADFSQYLDGIHSGQRNESFTRIIGSLLGCNVDVQLAWMLVTSLNQVHCHPPMDEDELLKTFESIAGREFAKRERRRGGRTA